MQEQKRPINRKDFIKSALRFVTFSGLLAAGVGLFSRKTAERKPGEQCINDFLCRGCRQLSRCYLPQAQSLKTVLGKK